MIRTGKIGPYTIYGDDDYRSHQLVLDNGWNYEPHIRQELERIVPGIRGFVDVGSAIGAITLMVKTIQPDTPVACVDCSQFNMRLLMRTIRENDIQNITLVNMAVSSEPGIILMNDCLDNTYTCETSKRDGQIESVGWLHFAAAMPLDYLDLPPIDLIKTDIEGMELAAWRGAKKLFSNKPKVIFEMIPGLLQRNGIDPAAELQWLLDLGYQITVLDNPLKGIRKTFTEAALILAYLEENRLTLCDMLAEPA